MKSTHAQCAEAIRRELREAFPGQLFSVTSSSASMMNEVSIRWTNGPTRKEVEAITGKYQQGSFNGMTDMYEYDNSNSSIPQVKYVTESREVTDDKYNAHIKAQNWADSVSERDRRDFAYRDIQDISFYERPTTTPVFNNERIQMQIDRLRSNGEAIVDRSAITMKINKAKGGIELYFPAKPLSTTLDDLKRNGWRWGKFNKCWYNLDTPAAREFANKYVITEVDHADAVPDDGGFMAQLEQAQDNWCTANNI